VSKEEEKKDESAAKKPSVITLIDRKRATNGAIMLSQFKIPFTSLRDFVIELNEDFITEEQVGHLLEFSPTKEELDIIREYTGPVTSLGKVEQYFLEIMKVPNLTTRLKAWRFKRKFNEKLNDITPEIKSILLASEEVLANEKLAKILELTLAIGNYLNGGNVRGGAFGFKIDILTKLRDTRSGSAKYTLLHYLVHQVDKIYPQHATFAQDMPHIEHASKLSVDFLDSELGALKREFEETKKLLANGEVNDEAFLNKMGNFIKEGQDQMDQAILLHQDMHKKYKQAVLFYCESPDQMKPDEFFSFISKFTDGFQQARAELEREERAKQKKEAKNINKGNRDKDKGVMDDLADSLRSGDVFRYDQLTRKQCDPLVDEGCSSSKWKKKKNKLYSSVTPSTLREDTGLHGLYWIYNTSPM
jgi:hypothetical protein